MNKLFSDFVNAHLIQHVHPVVCAKTYRVEFFEVLSRVLYNNKIYQPKEFLTDINVSQKYEMAKSILMKIKEYQKKFPSLSFSINISTLEMEDGLIAFLRDISNEKNIDPSRCVIEILESTSVSPIVLEQMEVLKESYGYRFALDDFGAGYSNLNQMLKTNGLFEYIKIDGSLVANIATSESKRLTLSAMVFAIQANKKKAIVEYITDCQTLKAVEDTNAEFLQGFAFGSPALLEEYIERLHNGMILPLSLEGIKQKKALS